MNKKTEQINCKVTKETRKIIEEQADMIGWTVSKLACGILENWTEDVKAGYRRATDFIKM